MALPHPVARGSRNDEAVLRSGARKLGGSGAGTFDADDIGVWIVNGSRSDAEASRIEERGDAAGRSSQRKSGTSSAAEQSKYATANMRNWPVAD
jgi:hypothetical protein